MNLKNVIVIACLLATTPAWSFVEIKMTYTSLASDSKEAITLSESSPNFPSESPAVGLGADLVFFIPLTGIGLGLRHEDLALDFKKSSTEYESNASRTSVLLGWRWIDTLVYFGPLLTYGISHSGGTAIIKEAGVITSNLTADSQASYSAGFELGAKLLGFRVGLEAGYMNYEWKKLTGTVGTTTNKLDLSGSYGKVTIGFGL